MIWHRNDYSQEAIEEMQREAEERVRDMQRRARLLSETPAAPIPPKERAVQKSPPPPPKPEQFSPVSSPFGGIADFLGSLEPSSDRLVIMALLWVLWNEHADKRLLIALVYLLL